MAKGARLYTESLGRPSPFAGSFVAECQKSEARNVAVTGRAIMLCAGRMQGRGGPDAGQMPMNPRAWAV